MRKNIKILKVIFFVSLAFILMFLVFHKTDVSYLIDQVLAADYRFVGLSLLFAFIAFASRAYRWKLLIDSFDRSVSSSNSFYALMTGYLANMALPRMGEITRCGVLAKSNDIKIEKLIGSVVSERIADLLMLFIIVVSLAILKADFFGAFIYKILVEPILGNSSAGNKLIAISFILLIAIVAYLLFRYISKKYENNRLIVKLRHFIEGLQQGIKSILKLPNKRQFLIHTAIIWIMYWAMTYVLFFAIPATKNLSMVDGIFIMVVGGIGMSAPVQNGFGVYHGLVASALMLYGIDYESNGLLFATISHESQTLQVIFWGCISLFAMFIKGARKTAEKKNDVE